MSNRARPLSPHLQVYRWQITMAMSILHRASGIVLSLSAFGLACWLVAVAQGGEAYERVAALLFSPLGKVAMFGASLALVYHLLNGIRHLLWDAGWGFELATAYRTGWAVMIGTAILTVAAWVLGYWARGAF